MHQLDFLNACQNGDFETAEKLLPMIDINGIHEDNPHTALYWVCCNNHEAILDLLLVHPEININKRSLINGYSALHIACYEENENIIKKLLTHGELNINLNILDITDMEEEDWDEFTENEQIIVENHATLVEMSRPAAVHIAAQSNVNILQLLINDPRTDLSLLDDHDCTCFFTACEYGHTDAVRLLLNDSRFDQILDLPGDIDGIFTPFMFACHNQETPNEVIQLLFESNKIDHQKKQPKTGLTGLNMLCENNDEQKIQIAFEILMKKHPKTLYEKDVKKILKTVAPSVFEHDDFNPDTLSFGLGKVKFSTLIPSIQTLPSIQLFNAYAYFALMILYADGYFSQKPKPAPNLTPEEVLKQKNARRVLELTLKLPMEMKGIFSYRMVKSSKTIAPVNTPEEKTLDEAFRRILKP